MRSPQLEQVVAVSDGFLVTRVGLGLYKTLDGSNWETLNLGASEWIDAWKDRPVSMRVEFPHEVYDLYTGENLPFSESYLAAAEGDREAERTGDEGYFAAPERFTFGPAGILVDNADPWDWQAEGPLILWWSPDGTTWRSWLPAELGAQARSIEAVVVGEDSVLLVVLRDEGPAVWVAPVGDGG